MVGTQSAWLLRLSLQQVMPIWLLLSIERSIDTTFLTYASSLCPSLMVLVPLEFRLLYVLVYRIICRFAEHISISLVSIVVILLPKRTLIQFVIDIVVHRLEKLIHIIAGTAFVNLHQGRLWSGSIVLISTFDTVIILEDY